MKLTAAEEESIYELAEKLTGSCQQGRYRRDLLILNVVKRIASSNSGTLKKYLNFANSNPTEYQKLISSLTIHTTSWFREEPHYDLLRKTIEKFHQKKYGRAFRLWSSACSTGEELFSAALVLQEFKNLNPDFEYELFGSDIDPVSVGTAAKMIYSISDFKNIPKRFHPSMMLGSGKTDGLMTLHPEIRKRCKFAPRSLVDFRDNSRDEKWDWIFCRNVLIYFDEKAVNDIVQAFHLKLFPTGLLCLGHSEAFGMVPPHYESLGMACYKISSSSNSTSISKTQFLSSKSALIIDDSLVIRKLLTKLFKADGWTVTDVGSAEEADVKIRNNSYHLITLDLKMAPVDGLTWLKNNLTKLKSTPVVIVSDSDPKEAASIFGALEGGAQDYILKSFLHQQPEEFLSKMNAMVGKVIQPAKSSIRYHRISEVKVVADPEVILMGASTGGPEAISKILKSFQGVPPPIVIVQHINDTFSRAFAERIGQISGITVCEPLDAETLQPGRLYLSYGDYHLVLKRDHGVLKLYKDFSPKHVGHRPAVDPLFESAAKCQVRSISILLTGMGRDGATGLKQIHDLGSSTTIVQDEESCVVFGMPKQAIDLGGAHCVANLPEMKDLLQTISANKKQAA